MRREVTPIAGPERCIVIAFHTEPVASRGAERYRGGLPTSAGFRGCGPMHDHATRAPTAEIGTRLRWAELNAPIRVRR